MAEWPHITILVVTYNRPYELTQTLMALDRHLVYPESKLHYLIADDCSPAPPLTPFPATVVQTSHNSGLGANANNGLAHVQTDYVLQSQDDFVLKRDLNLFEAVALLETQPEIGMVRYVGATMPLTARLKFTDVSGRLPDYGRKTFQPGLLHYWEIVSHVTPYPACDWPHLKHRRFHQFYGNYPEGLNIHDTENGFGEHVQGASIYKGAPQIALLPDWVKFGGIAHIAADSYQDKTSLHLRERGQ